MADYDFRTIEPKWQQYWREHRTYEIQIDLIRPKYYVLDVFPYPCSFGCVIQK